MGHLEACEPLSLSSTVTLRGGAQMPRLGFGTYKAGPGAGTEDAVRWALEAGYRHIDGAWFYGNEEEIGRAIARGGVSRDELFVTSKLWIDAQAYDDALAACEKGLARIGLDYFDLYLIHWPVQGLWRQAWRAMEELQRRGLCRAIGVSNFTVSHMQELLGFAEAPPAVNQLELTPFQQQREVVDLCLRHDIVLESFSPLTRGSKFDHPAVALAASRSGKTPAQVLLRWCLQKGFVTLPKSATKERIFGNTDLYDFELTPTEMAALDASEDGFSTVKPAWRAQFAYESGGKSDGGK